MDSRAEERVVAVPSPKPSLRWAIAAPATPPDIDAPPTPDELDRIERWRHTSMEERGRALADHLRLVDAIGHFRPKREMFPGFRAIVAEKDRGRERA